MKNIMKTLTGILGLLAVGAALMSCRPGVESRISTPPEGFTTVDIRSSHDGTQQKALWWSPPGALRGPGQPGVEGKVPLLVALHTWSGDYQQETSLQHLQQAMARGWAIIHPDFRGPNRAPMACASDAAVADIVDAVEYAKSAANIDDRRIYLVGGSGGGHMALVMAHRHPKIWAGVSSWVPISDLAAWYKQLAERAPKYREDLEAVCGGAPGTSVRADSEYRKRSPLFQLSAAKGLPIDINAGIHDGHTGAVPISHTLLAFNKLAVANGFPEAAFSSGDIETMTAKQQVPESLRTPVRDPTMEKPVLLRRYAGPVRVTIFEGGHEILYDAAFVWLARQRKQPEAEVATEGQ